MRRAIYVLLVMWIPIALVLTLALVSVMGVVLIPYNVARITAWLLDKILEGLAAAIHQLEQTL